MTIQMQQPLILASLGSAVLGWLMFILSVFLILLILVQRGKGGGLAGALGGPGGQSAFGSKAGDMFTVITAGTAIVWGLVCAIAMYSLGTPPLTADDLIDEITPSLTSGDEEPPIDPEAGLGGAGLGGTGLSGLAELLNEDAAGENDAVGEEGADEGTPSAELTPAGGDAAESAEESAEEASTDADSEDAAASADAASGNSAE